MMQPLRLHAAGRELSPPSSQTAVEQQDKCVPPRSKRPFLLWPVAQARNGPRQLTELYRQVQLKSPILRLV